MKVRFRLMAGVLLILVSRMAAAEMAVVTHPLGLATSPGGSNNVGQLNPGSHFLVVLELEGAYAKIRYWQSATDTVAARRLVGWARLSDLGLDSSVTVQRAAVLAPPASATQVIPYAALAPGDAVRPIERIALRSDVLAGDVMAWLTPDEVVNIKAIDNDYAQIEFTQSYSGYVPAQYLSACIEIAQCWEATTVVNVRDGKGTTHQKLGKLDKGQRVQLISMQGDYAQIRVDTPQTAWALSSLLSKDTPESAVFSPKPPMGVLAESEPLPIAPSAPKDEGRMPQAAPLMDEPKPALQDASKLRIAVQLSGGVGQSLDSKQDLQANLAKEGSDTFVFQFEDSEQSVEALLRIGYASTPRFVWGVETGYLDLGEFAVSIQRRSDSPSQAARAMEEVKPWGGDGALIGGFAQYRLARFAWTSASAGAFLPFDTSQKIDFGNAVETLQYNSSGLTFSLGVQFMLMQNTDLMLQSRMVNINRGLVSTTAGLQYRF